MLPAMEATVAPPRPASAPVIAWRTVLAYLGIVAIDTWAFFVVQDVQMGRGLGADAALGTTRFVGSALVFVPLAAALLIPAAVLTRDLAWRRPPASAAGRALGGAVAWAGWGAFVALSVSASGGLVYLEASLLAAIVGLAVSGAAFAVLGLGRDATPPGRLAIGTGLAIAVVVITFGMFMAGRWGGPV